MSASAPDVLAFAKRAHESGICVVRARLDGSKRPVGEWKMYQEERPSDEQIREWFGSGYSGHGYVTGAVSGGLEFLDFDDHDAFERFVGRAAERGLVHKRGLWGAGGPLRGV